ncbi:MAG: 6-carboxytetrahydropterin synthase [Pseudomonadota bacterium]
MMRPATIEIFTEDLCFSAGHFTIFSASERENFHGHDYHIHAILTTLIDATGIRFDYRHYHKKLLALCHELDGYFLLPANSPHLDVQERQNYIDMRFNGEQCSLLKKDCIILAISNTTVEELSNWILDKLLEDKADIEKNLIQSIEIKISASPGKSASTKWQLTN